MKKFIATALSLVMLVSIFSAFASLSEAAASIWVYNVDKTTTVSAQRQKIAVTRSKSYTVSYSGSAADATYPDNGVRLTDGGSGSGNSYLSVATGSGTTTVVIDLGYKAIGFTDFYARFHNSSSNGYTLPTAVNYYVSDDNVTYNFAGTGENVASPSDETAYSIGFTKEKGCAAQYIKIEIKHSGKIACSEISCYIWADVTTISDTGAADSQGLVYSANTTAGTAYVTSYTNSYTKTEIVQGTGITPCTATGKVDNTTWIIGKGTEDQTTVTADFVSKSRNNRPGTVNNNKKYIVIHNTGNYATGATAKANHNYQTTNAACTTSSWQYTVGTDGIYQGIPDNEVAWHAGDGSTGTGNYYGIGMEIAVNGWVDFTTNWQSFLNNGFYKSCRRGALLTAELCVRWGLNPGDGSPGTGIRQHWDSTQKNCPQQMRYDTSAKSYTRNTGDMWEYFMSYVTKYYEMLKGGGSYEVTTEVANTVTNVEIPQYVYVSSSNTYCRVTGISGAAFSGKSNLKSVYIPNTITWGSPTFDSANLVNINVSPTCTYYYSKGGVLYSSADNSVVSTPAKNSGTGAPKADAAVYGVANFTLGESYEVDYDADTNEKLFTGFYRAGSVASEIREMFVDDVKVFDKNGNAVADNAKVGTGTILKSADGEDTCTLIVYGDIDGDAVISSTDYAIIRKHLTGRVPLTGIYYTAASIIEKGTITTADLLHVRKMIHS